MIKKYFLVLPVIIFLFAACKEKNQFDASGTFEAIEVIVSSEANGKLMQFDILEGQNVSAGQLVGYVDSIQLYLHKRQLLANVTAILVTKPDINKQIAGTEQEIANQEKEKRRTENLVSANAVPRKQLDDINEQIKVLQKQLIAQRSSFSTTAKGIEEQSTPVDFEARQIEDQLRKCRIINPISGTVLAKYAEAGEITSVDKPLYRIADLSVLKLKAYITNGQLSQVKVGQVVNVFIDNGDKTYKELQGTISWVSDKAEFTPKTIQTKEERANLVYAIKIDVKNNGYLKIGMYGEVKFK
jgi:HlyD family secretion protein